MGGYRYNEQPAQWVDQQHKTMIKWINAKLNTNLTDLSKDLNDGLILIQLINKIIREIDIDNKNLKLYLLKPLYHQPKFKLQKMENINDFLEFIRIVLKINITSISADNIFDGNLKLILGLIWSIFIFSTSNSIGILNEGNSIIEIKKLLMNWVNLHSKLYQITNFNRDWSIEINSPDKILTSILKNYLPIDILNLNNSKFFNLKTILEFVEKIGIPKLAEIEDFQSLVPDEKCILFYLIEWYKFFELSNNFEVINESHENNDLPSGKIETEYFDNVIVKINEIIKFKYEYETKSLRFSNKLITINSKYDTILKNIDNSPIFKLLANWDACFKNFNMIDVNALIKEFKAEINMLTETFDQIEEINGIISKLHSNDVQSLEQINLNIYSSLKLINKDFKFKISKNLEYDNLFTKFEQILNLQLSNNKKFNEFLQKLLKHNVLCNINNYVKTVENYVLHNANREISDEQDDNFDGLLKNFEIIINFIDKLDYYSQHLSRSTPPTNLKSTTTFNSTCQEESIKFTYNNFKSNLLKFDDKLITDDREFRLILEDMTTIHLSSQHIKTFMKSVPVKFVTLSSNDSDFNLLFDDDDDDDSIDNAKLIFEGNRKKVGCQLSGNKDRVYDLELFFIKFEDGLKI